MLSEAPTITLTVWLLLRELQASPHRSGMPVFHAAVPARCFHEALCAHKLSPALLEHWMKSHAPMPTTHPPLSKIRPITIIFTEHPKAFFQHHETVDSPSEMCAIRAGRNGWNDKVSAAGA